MERPDLMHALMPSILTMVMGAFLLLIWLIKRQQSPLKYVGIAYIAYAICHIQLITQTPASLNLNLASTGLFYCLFAVFIYAGIVRLAGRKPRWMLIAAVASCIMIFRYHAGANLDDRALVVYLVLGLYVASLSFAMWEAKKLREESSYAAILFYLVVGFIVALLFQATLTDSMQTDQYGYSPIQHWHETEVLFSVFLIAFYTVLIVVIASRGISNAKLEGATDPLTDLYNRRGFDDVIQNLLTETNNFSLISLDLDRFKAINDTYGHHGGDDVLRVVAQQIQSNIRKSDVASRIGGEEFLIFLPDTDIQEAAVIAERLRIAISDRPTASRGSKGGGIRVTASLGVCEFSNSNSDNTLSQAYRFVDGLLYEAKKNGRNQVVAKLA